MVVPRFGMPPGSGSKGVKWPKTCPKLPILIFAGLELAFDLEGVDRVDSCERKRFYLRLSRCCSSAYTAPRLSLPYPTGYPGSG
jgi:hypothetical protein